MNRNSQELKELLLGLIYKQKQDLTGLVVNPDKDFSRNRKIPYENMILSLLTLEGASLSNELLRQFGCNATTATTSAFVQQRKKILPAALETLFHDFTSQTNRDCFYKGYRLLAVDGSDIQIATNPNDNESFLQTKEGVKPYNLLRLNALYNLLTHTYEDAIVYKAKEAGENTALIKMIERSNLTGKIIVTADRGYEAYNNMAHIQEKGWFYLIRIKDFSKHKTGILHGLELPNTEEFDEYVDLNITRKQTNEMKQLLKQKNKYRWIPHRCNFDYLPLKNKKSDPTVLYHLPFRIVRFSITDNSYEVVVTNLDSKEFPPAELKKLYKMRWGIETSFRDLKYTVGLLHFHSKKVEYILQEIFSSLIMYNFSELITSHVVIEKGNRKYEYKVNFSVAVHICRDFLLKINIPPNIESLIARYITPIRPGRSRPREMKVKQAISFMYRVA
ncbi:MAG: IS4 family transposase [Blautia sp.]|nr:IS4 family transposase [Blautia sp.]